MRLRHACLPASACGLICHAAFAGPPFLTDDPEPTDLGHWEIYGPQLEAEGRSRTFEGTAGAELNYGAAPDLQLTLGLPAAWSHSPGDWQLGAGDLKLSAKYRFVHDEDRGFSIAAFPGVTLPTAGKHLGADHVTALLPVWFQQDSGPWSVFGGGGYAINPGTEQRNYWTGGLAISRQLSEAFLMGIEVDRQGADEISGNAATSLGLGFIVSLPGSLRLLGSGGPSFEDHGGATSLHAFLALGWDR